MSAELERYVGQLAKAHGFTLAELEANRGGALHESQVTRGDLLNFEPVSHAA